MVYSFFIIKNILVPKEDRKMHIKKLGKINKKVQIGIIKVLQEMISL